MQLYGNTALFPVAFLSNVFVPADTLPNLLQPIPEINPVSVLTDAVRSLMLTGAEAMPIVQSLLWAVVLAVVVAPVAVHIFNRKV